MMAKPWGLFDSGIAALPALALSLCTTCSWTRAQQVIRVSTLGCGAGIHGCRPHASITFALCRIIAAVARPCSLAPPCLAAKIAGTH